MTVTWVVVAHRAGARIFEHRGPGLGLVPIRVLSHPEGRLRDREITSDRPGSLRGGGGPGPKGLASDGAPEHEATVFAKEIAGALESGRMEARYEQLVIVAPPRFLGRVRAALSSACAQRVLGCVDKDLPDASGDELAPHLASLIAV